MRVVAVGLAIHALYSLLASKSLLENVDALR